MSTFLSKIEIAKINDIIANLVLKNMESGMSYTMAKVCAFNRMNRDFKEALTAWLMDHEKLEGSK